jgi:Kelch motif protein
MRYVALVAFALVLTGCADERIRGGKARGFQELAPVVVRDKVVVIAGVDYDQASVKGMVIDLPSRRAKQTAPSGLYWQYGVTAVAAHGDVIVWGGCHGGGGRGSRAPGALYDVAGDRWTHLRDGPRRARHTAVWTGEEMIVWGGFTCDDRPRADGAAYAGSWRTIARAPISPRSYHVAVWTGEEMIVWGGSRGRRLLVDGAAYDPERDRWRRLAKSPFRTGRLGLGMEPDLDADWTGALMTIWGPRGGATYDPERDRWQRIPAPPPELRDVAGGQTAWSGGELVVWGHSNGWGSNLQQGAAFDPASRVWRALPDAPIRGRDRHAMVAIPRGVLVWGGCCRSSRYYGDGAIVTTRAGAPPPGARPAG